ncbi:MAG: PKD domain-containing protein [Bacteroidetes bacterium]|nr:PKD domain-containing protein [Bacteroidota bacterium]
MKNKYFVFCIAAVLYFFSSTATTITIGTGVSTNTNTSYPAPYGNWYFGAKHQFLILATELNAAGMTAGNINSLAFKVQTINGVALQGFTIAMKNTLSSSASNFETGLTTVFNPISYTETTGLNTHTFSTPFYWDGTSNLLVETCFNNTAYTNNALMYYSSTSFQSSVWNIQDASGVCGSTSFAGASFTRPNMVFDWNAAAIPPTTNFTANPTMTCSGFVSFYDLSDGFPTSWNWDFGDGNTSTSQNPTHTYSSGGTFTVRLITCNAYGCDTLVNNNMITVNLSPQLPIAASCTPSTLTYCCDFGITNVTFNTINNTSGDGVEGYSDFTCSQTTVFAGQTYTLSIQTVAQSTQNYGAWIDYNNDGIFSNTTERVFTATSVLNTSGNIVIPGGVTLNTPLRMRVSADYDFSAAPLPCTDLDFGQAEDYTIIITQNTNPPVADFIAANTTTCNGTVCFTDLSTNVPTGWFWNFGDGQTSALQNPCHTYAFDGTYTVSLSATNVNGGDTIIKINYITVNTAAQVTTPSCNPSTLAYCCGYGITNVSFNTINNSTVDAIEGYQDFSCTYQTTISEGNVYPLTITTGVSNAQDTRVWIDFNNDGIFNNTNELVMDAPNSFNPTINYLVPTGAVLNTPLRMRVSSDVVGTAQNGCTNNDFGQTEDYGVVILLNTTPPVSNFSGTPTSTCTDTIYFTDLSTGSPTSWTWYFGDGTTSSLQNPSHFYALPNIYTVSLVVTNAFGQDSIAFTNYINTNCPTTMPTTGIVTDTNCSGTLYDSGGPSANYTDNTDGVLIIQPAGATSIVLNFVSFDFEDSFDFLIVYDGPSTASPIIGYFTGNVLPSQVISSGGTITIQQQSDVSISASGFELNWYCNTVGVNNLDEQLVDYIVFPNPTSNIINIKSSTNSILKIKQLSLVNTIGQVVLQEQVQVDNTILQLNVNQLPKGLYFLTIISDNGEIIKKINIQ